MASSLSRDMEAISEDEALIADAGDSGVASRGWRFKGPLANMVVCIFGFVGGVCFTSYSQPTAHVDGVANIVSMDSTAGTPDVKKKISSPKYTLQQFPHLFESPEAQFHYYDANKDGFVNVDDLNVLDDVGKAFYNPKYPSLTPFTQAEMHRAVDLFDTNKDKKISKEEFIHHTNKATEAAIKAEKPVCTTDKKKCIQSEDVKQYMEKATKKAQELRRLEESLPPKPVKSRMLSTYKGQPMNQIDGLWTFGAPATSLNQFKNGLHASGEFPGMRIYTRSRTPGWFWGYYEKTDPVAWITSFGVVFSASGKSFQHARQKSLIFPNYEPDHPVVEDVSDEQAWWPGRDVYYWVSGHSEYLDQAKRQTGYPFLVKFAHFATWMAYMNTEKEVEAHLAEHTPGFKLLGRSSSKGYGMMEGMLDYTHLVQEESSKTCGIVFRGTDDLSDWMSNLAVNTVHWCGYEGVHLGFRDELKRALEDPSWAANIKPKLATCSSVHVGGHSLGGAQSELFAACVNNPKAPGDAGYEDYKLVEWDGSLQEKYRQHFFKVKSSSPAGSCEITDDGKCVTDGMGNHDSNEACTIEVLKSATLKVADGDFHTESGYDFITVNGQKFSGNNKGPDGVAVAAATTFTWEADHSIENGGFKICAE